jgi:hypothetical protein
MNKASLDAKGVEWIPYVYGGQIILHSALLGFNEVK